MLSVVGVAAHEAAQSRAAGLYYLTQDIPIQSNSHLVSRIAGGHVQRGRVGVSGGVEQATEWVQVHALPPMVESGARGLAPVASL